MSQKHQRRFCDNFGKRRPLLTLFVSPLDSGVEVASDFLSPARCWLVLGTGTRVPGSLPVTRVVPREFLLPGCCPLNIVV